MVATHPPGISAPSRRASRILLPAAVLIEASKRNGGSLREGTAIAIGFRPTIGFEPNVGGTERPPTVIAMPIMSCSSAIMAW